VLIAVNFFESADAAVLPNVVLLVEGTGVLSSGVFNRAQC